MDYMANPNYIVDCSPDIAPPLGSPAIYYVALSEPVHQAQLFDAPPVMAWVRFDFNVAPFPGVHPSSSMKTEELVTDSPAPAVVFTSMGPIETGFYLAPDKIEAAFNAAKISHEPKAVDFIG